MSFLSRAIFIKEIGVDLLGLNTLLIGIIGYLNLAEMGIAPAISYSLYKPIREGNREKVCEIITLQGWLYRWVSMIIILGAVVLLFFFPKIFENANIPLGYAYLAFGVLFFSNLLGYFYNYKQIVFTADMKQYVLTKNVQGLTILKVVLQIILIYMLPYAYLWWVALEFLFAILITLNIIRVTQRDYPWLVKSKVSIQKLRVKYREVIVNMKNIFAHHISTIVIEKTDNLIIFVISTLSIITKYNNYMTISLGVITFVSVLFSGIRDAVGNLISEGNTNKNIAFFFEFTSVKFFLSGLICLYLYFMYDDFISLWLGDRFVIDHIVKLGILANLFISIARSTDFFLAGYGLFNDVWVVFTEVILCVVLALLLGHFYGLAGVIWGFFIGKFPIIYLWKPYFLFTSGFRTPVIRFFTKHLAYIGLMLLPLFVTLMVHKYLEDLFFMNGYITFVMKSILYFGIILVSSFPIYFLFLEEFKGAVIRLWNTFRNR